MLALNLVTEVIRIESLEKMWEDMDTLLQQVDADFTGMNGIDLVLGQSAIEIAISKTEQIANVADKIIYVLEACKKSSSDYYNKFECELNNIGNVIVVSVATTMKETFKIKIIIC